MPLLGVMGKAESFTLLIPNFHGGASENWGQILKLIKQ